MGNSFDMIPAAGSSHYGDIAAVRRLIGQVNEQAYADVNADDVSAEILAQEDASGSDADVRTRVQFTALGLSVPDRTADPSSFEIVAFAANRYWAEGMGKLRGLPVDAQGRPVNPYKAYVLEADAAIQGLIGKLQRGTAGLLPTADQIIECGPVALHTPSNRTLLECFGPQPFTARLHGFHW